MKATEAKLLDFLKKPLSSSSQLQTRVYGQFWRPMEVEFGQETCGTQFYGFIRHYLTVKSGDIPKLWGGL